MGLGHVFGIKLILNPLFLFLLGLYVWLGMSQYLSAVLLSLVAHEMAHLVMARGYGLRVNEVELLPFGGVARIEDLAESDAYVESAVAVVGPISNFFLAGLAYFLGNNGWLGPESSTLFLETNLGLALFNLLPALPLDGGRLLRAYLARKVGFRRASEDLALVGRLLALLLLSVGLLALLVGYLFPSLLILAGFLLFSAGREKKEAMFVLLRHLMSKRELLLSEGVLPAAELVVLESVSLGEVVRRFLPHKYHLVLLLDQELRPKGSLEERELLEALLHHGPEVTMKEIRQGR